MTRTHAGTHTHTATVPFFFNSLEALLGFAGQAMNRGDKEKANSFLIRPPHSAAELMEIRKSKVIGPVDNHGIRCGNIDPVLNDRRTDQQVGLPFDEIKHDLFQLFFRHLAVANTDFRLGDQPAQEIGHRIDRLHPVMDKIHLSTATQFAQDRITDQVIVKPGDIGANRLAINRRRIDNRQVTQAGKAQVQGARYWRRRHDELVRHGAFVF